VSEPGEKKVKWRERVAQSGELARVYGKALKLAWQSSPFDFGLLTVLTLVQGVVPAFQIYLTKLIVDAVTLAPSAVRVGELVALWVLGLLLGHALQPWHSLLSGNLNERLSNEVMMRVIRKANTFPDLEPFENKTFYDDLQLIYNESGYRPINFVFQTIGIGLSVFSSLGFLALLGTLAWWIPLLVLASGIPALLVQRQLERQGFWWEQRKNEDRRMMGYTRRVATTDEFAKEVRLYGLGDFFEQRYDRSFQALHGSMRALRARKALVPIPTTLLSLLGNGFAFYWIVAGVANGTVTAGGAVLFVQSLAQLQSWVDNGIATFGWFAGTLEFFKKYFSFLSSTPSMPMPPSPQPVPADLTIRFENVSFAYPDGRKALEDVSFTVRPGERLALVGENGAGKTTIVKLLMRLYDPSSGRVTVGGVDLRELDLAAWRASVGAVFQDFVKYQLSTRENIAVGALERIQDNAALEGAAARSGFDLEAIKLDQMLGKQFDGTDLSGGQWQKLATARAFLRDARVLVLDEPSAALDPKSEAALFDDFVRLSDGKTTFLVTHRLASTARADRILVLKAGRLVESGAHTALMAQGGEYAQMYTVQAAQYATTPTLEPVH
jgi:ABC-type multidrug transport system fused ATPase/permease subunit